LPHRKPRGTSVGTADARKSVVIVRSLAKSCIASAYNWSGARHWLNRANPAELPFIAGYHRVVTNFEDASRRTIPSMLISARTFEKHLDWLGRRFNFVSLDDVGLHLANERQFKRPSAAITFDDGYADIYHNAFPILKRKGIPAAVFIVTDLAGTSNVQIYDRLYACLSRDKAPAFSTMTQMLTKMSQREVLDRLRSLERDAALPSNHGHEFMPLSWEMIEHMQNSDITIGSHTTSHVLLTSESVDEVRRQLIESRQTLESRLRRKIEHFAYPDGRFNKAVLETVHQSGYRFAYTICPQRDSRFPLLTIPRKILWENACTNMLGQFSPSVMRCQTDGVFDRKGACEHIH
jgi:peptidoglycan/xylan/chitin deacetylase (PgdA/CDA1 family)